MKLKFGFAVTSLFITSECNNMKTYLCLSFGRGFFILLLGASLCLASFSRAADLTLYPASISNTYSGQITLQITGLTNGETVAIERFLDANNDGTNNAGQPLVQSFKITDGQVTSFGGV